MSDIDIKSLVPVNGTTLFSEAVDDTSVLGLPAKITDLQIIKAGGMGAIYKARHALTGATLAVKVMLPHLLTEEAQLKRFKQESQLVCSLSSEFIVRVLDFDITPENVPYIIMEFIEGQSLRQRLQEKGHVSIEEGLRIFADVAAGLAHAHSRGIIHRDIKPDNIMISTDDKGDEHVKIVDFGIAKAAIRDSEELMQLTATGEVVGTPYYMSPEQSMGRQLDQRCDIYSLGCVMYHAFCGNPPFTGVSVVQVMAMHASDPAPEILDTPVGKTFPRSLRNIIIKCMEKEPADRYQSMDELLADLNEFKRTGRVHIITGRQKRLVLSWLKVGAFTVLGFIVAFLLVTAFDYLTKSN